MLSPDGPSGVVEGDGPPVVSEPTPRPDDIAARRGGQTLDRREEPEEPPERGYDARSLRLLEHDLAHQDPIGRRADPPRVSPSARLVPIEQRVTLHSGGAYLDSRCRPRPVSSPEVGQPQTIPTARVPFRLRLGVVGHRTIDATPALEEVVEREVSLLLVEAGRWTKTPVLLEIVSALSEGADRLVAERAMAVDPQSTLEVPLPMALEDYRRDFHSAESKAQFDRLLSRADRTVQLPARPSRNEAYHAVATYIVESCDVVLAIWDGRPERGPGGTAEVVHGARSAGLPLVWIDSGDEHRVRRERFDRPPPPLSELDRFNTRASAVPSGRLTKVTEEWLDAAAAHGVRSRLAQPVIRWAMPFFARSDWLAKRYRSRLFALTLALPALAVAAVAVAAAQSLLLPSHRVFALLEVGFTAIGAILWFGFHHAFQTRWAACRAVAERIRADVYLALAGARRDHHPVQLHFEPAESRDWVNRAVAEIWRTHPDVSVPKDDLRSVRMLAADHWLRGQARYYAQRAQGYRRRDRYAGLATVVLFAVTLAAAIVHAGGWLEDGPLPPWLQHLPLLVAIVVPAVAGAILSVAAGRQYHRRAMTYERVGRQLDALGDRVRYGAEEELGDVLLEAARTMENENVAWMWEIRAHEVEFPV
jgi:conflict system pore-forming effector with SLATT domain